MYTKSRYRAAGLSVVDATGEKGTMEFLNISKNDALGWPELVHCSAYPGPVERGIPTVVRPFVEKSVEVNKTILDIFNNQLSLPEGYMSRLHAPDEQSGCEARLLKNPPMPHNTQKRALGAHTDFGSLVSKFV